MSHSPDIQANVFFILLCIGEECKTVEGESDNNYEPNQLCLFPFIYQNTTASEPQTYYECTTDDNNDTPWCPTSLKEGKVVDKKWGRCNFGCPGATAGINNTLYYSLRS